MKKQFNTNDWLPSEELQGKPYQRPEVVPGADDHATVERAIEALEAAGKDITAGYATWIRIGFALAHFGESGRNYFHRVSQFNREYDPEECDLQYDRCLRSNGQGVTLGSFFHLLKEAGISIPRQGKEDYPPMEVPSLVPPADPGPPEIWMKDSSFPTEEAGEEAEPVVQLPSFPQEVFDNLPPFLRETVAFAESPEERDILLLGSLVTLSSALPNVYGYYHGKKVYPHLYLFVTAPASAGKGQLNLCKNLVLPVHKAKRELSKSLKEAYEREIAIYNTSKDGGDKPQKPPEKMHFIPANNSTSGLFQLLYDNNSQGLIFETEGDTLASAFKSDFGNYSDGFRKAFHNETISCYRKTDREYVHLDQPMLATVLSGTPRQVISLIPDAENGLFSRFMFYYFNLDPDWKDVFAKNGIRGIENHYLDLGENFYEFHKELLDQQPMKIVLSKIQQERFNTYFSTIQLRYLAVDSKEYLSSIRRLGLITFRLAMILSALRYKEDQHLSKLRQCDDRDFEAVMAMARVLVQHSSHVFHRLPAIKKPLFHSNVKEKFLDSLPRSFTRSDYVERAKKFKLTPRTCDKYISHFLKYGLVERVRHGEYELAS